MFSTGFSMKSLEFAEDKEGATESFLKHIAHKTGSLVGGGWIEKNGSALPFNTFSLVSPTGVLARYRKIHPFSFAGEDKFYTPGNELIVLDWKGWKLTPLICYDLRFPESFRQTSGITDLYLVIANWPSVRISHWLSLLEARALENQAYVFGLNRVGSAGRKEKLFHNGFSAIIDPWGRKSIDSGERESLFSGSLSIVELREIRAKNPYLKDIQGIKPIHYF